MNKAARHTQLTVREQAAEWFVAFDSNEVSDAGKRRFLKWLKQSPENIKEFLQISALNAEIGGCALLDREVDELIAAARADAIAFEAAAGSSGREPMPAEDQRPRSAKRAWVSAAAAVLVAVYTGYWLWPEPDVLPRQIYSTELGEQRSITLDDGSVVSLNTLTQVEVLFDGAERRVRLVAGEALFDVTKDAARPFIVDAGSMHLTVVGTRFNVYKQADAAILTVVEGEVAVEAPLLESTDGLSPATDTEFSALAGHRVSVTANGASMTEAGESLMEESTAWTERKFIFRKQPLATVVREFNRYNRLKLFVDDSELGGRLVDGTFKTHDTELLAMLLDGYPEIDVIRDESGIYIRPSSERAMN